MSRRNETQHEKIVALSDKMSGAEIGRRLGLSRERVRQILAKHGLKSKRFSKVVGIERAAELIMSGKTSKEITAALKLPDQSRIFSIATSLGPEYHAKLTQTNQEHREKRIEKLTGDAIRQVQEGASIRVACKYNRNLEALVGRRLAKLGIEAKSRNPHRDYSHRIPMIRKLKKQNKSWDEITEIMNAYEKEKFGLRPVKKTALMVYWVSHK